MLSQTTKPWLAFSKDWFLSNQKWIIPTLNYPLLGSWLRSLLGIPDARPIAKLSPNAYHVLLNPTMVEAHFLQKPEYAKRLYHAFKPVWWILHAWDWAVADRWLPRLSYGFATLTVSPDASPETATVDGRIYRNVGGGEAFATIRGGAGTTAEDSSATSSIPSLDGHNTTPDVYVFLARGVLLFDTSSLTSGATISAAVLRLYVSAVSDNHDCAVGITSAAPASNTALATGDYALASFGSTKFATDIDLGAITTSAYNEWALNASGIAAVSLTGITKFGVRWDHDIDNTTPTFDVGVSSMTVSMADAGSNKPELVVTYTIPATGLHRMFLVF